MDFLAVLQLRQGRLHGRNRLAGASFLIQQLFRRAVSPVHMISQGEIKGNLCPHRRIGIVAPHIFSVPVSAGFAVQGVAHGIQDGCLSRSRRTADQEKTAAVQLFKVDDRFLCIGAEGLHGQPDRSHFFSSSR